MNVLYDTGIYLYGAAIRLASLFNPKAKEWVRGRRGQFSRIGHELTADRPTVWVHAASLGEFEQGRPVIEKIRERYPQYRIVLTFFSPSGFELRRDYDKVDHVYYMPLDTRRNARRFVRLIRPEVAVFIKYEFWLNFLHRLGRTGTRTYMVSAIFRRDSVFFRPYGGIFRKVLPLFERIYVQDEGSRQMLAGIGVDNVTVAGDTRFDRVCKNALQPEDIPLVEKFVSGYPVLVAGSTWPEDEKMIRRSMEGDTRFKLLLAPHEIHGDHIDSIMRLWPGRAVRYSELTRDTDLENVSVLVVDSIGMLSSLYRYGTGAYIGGGFGAGIHNTLEAAVFGKPVVFGPNYHRFKEARDLISAGAARAVATDAELSEWISRTMLDRQYCAAAGKAAYDYVMAGRGATDMVLEGIFGYVQGGEEDP